MSTSTARTQQNDTVDSLCWRHYGRTLAVVESVLQANPGLAKLGLVLPQGLEVVMPELAAPAAKPMIQLWD